MISIRCDNNKKLGEIDPATLSRWMGHASPSFTMKRYVQFFERARPAQAPTLRELVGSQGGILGGTNPSLD